MRNLHWISIGLSMDRNLDCPSSDLARPPMYPFVGEVVLNIVVYLNKVCQL